MENLFTNVPVQETINIIINNIYHHPTLPLLKIDSNTIRKILFTLYYSGFFLMILMEIYIFQRDGIAIRSVLGPIVSHFYISVLENTVFNTINKPNIYLRYADVILYLTNSIYEINIIQETFQNNSILNITREININNKILFLGVLIDTNNIDWFITSTYKKKPTNINPCTLNFQSECSFRYKRTIIKTLISRAKLLSSSQTNFLNKLKKY